MITKQAVIAVRNIKEDDLPWALVDAAKPHLNILERNYVFVTIGAGDTFAAIYQLLKSVAGKRIPLRPRLVQLCATWLDAYAGHDMSRRRTTKNLLAMDFGPGP